ncbi:MAG: hypothetical protein IK038_11965 [Bacteroidaceae bacterium]|nr:hypothetical protein [Bacteroidaceae bacterium]
MVLNDYTKQIMAEYIKDMFDAGMTTYGGEFTDRANAIHRRIRGRGFCDFFTNLPMYINGATLDEIASRLDNARVWILESTNTDRWIWHTGLPRDTTDERFLEIINNNRQMYGLQQSSYTQSEMARAARLLDDEMQYEI